MALTRVVAALVLICCGIAATADAQGVPSEPIRFGGGRVVLGGDVAASISTADPGFFTYGDYEHSTLRELRLDLSADVHATDWMSILAELRSENLDGVSPFALYARIRPWREKRFDIQAGRIPPTFGRFSRQAYTRQNPLIGYPLAYQYLTPLRPDALPADTDELVRMRTRGWRSNFTIGNLEAAPGVPLVNALRWDTGVQATAGWRALTMSGAVTTGTASNPLVADDNAGKQIAARLSIAAAPGLDLGGSFARGAFVGRSAAQAAGARTGSAFLQSTAGVDGEYARGRWVTRAEVIATEWQLPLAATRTVQPLRSMAGSLEARYSLGPGLYAAARIEHLAFSRIPTTAGSIAWDAPVTRAEAGGGYYILRNVVLRASVQLNRRDAGRVTSANLVAAQLLFWF